MHTVEMAAIAIPWDPEDGDGPTRSRRGPLTTREVALLVAGGGALGALARWSIELLLPATYTPTLIEVPWGTLLANLLGCLGLGALTGVLEVRPRVPRWMQPFLGLGFCGSFTTVSAVVLQISAAVGADFPLVGLQYGVGTVVTAVTGIVAGLLLGRRLGRRSAPRRTGAGR